jgi:basic membrane protein A
LALETARGGDEFEELIVRGVESAGDRFGLDSLVLEPPYTDLADELRRVAAQRPALMFGAFNLHTPLLRIAADHPDTTFVLIDALTVPVLPNVVAVNSAVEQGSYLVGAAAALESATGKVGYIGANSQPFIEAFRAGFEQGAAAANPDVEIVAELIDPPVVSGLHEEGGYFDPDRAHEIATAMYDDGVDVIFVAAGGSGQGVIEAATERSTAGRKLWAIGVDNDDYFDISEDQRGHLLTSMYKRFDLGIERVMADHIAGKLSEERSITVDLADGAVGYTETGGHLGPGTIDKLETFRTEIVDGTTIVDPTPSPLPPPPSPFILDIATGARTPLPDSLVGGLDYWVSPDESRIAFGKCCTDDDGITVADIDGTNLRALTRSDGSNQYAAAWSPDGTRLVYQEHQGASLGRLFVEDLATGEKAQIVDLQLSDGAWWWLAPSVSPDGEHVIFQRPRADTATEGFDVWSVALDGGTPRLVVPNAISPMYFPDGETIAVVDPAPSDVYGLRISIVESDGSRRTLVTAEEKVWNASMSPDGSRIAYADGANIRIVDVATGKSTVVAEGFTVEWLSDDRLLIVPR